MGGNQSNPDQTHPYSELLEGTRPAIDARLIQDIMQSPDQSPDPAPLTLGPTPQKAPRIVVHARSLPVPHSTTRNGASPWDSFFSS